MAEFPTIVSRLKGLRHSHGQRGQDSSRLKGYDYVPNCKGNKNPDTAEPLSNICKLSLDTIEKPRLVGM